MKRELDAERASTRRYAEDEALADVGRRRLYRPHFRRAGGLAGLGFTNEPTETEKRMETGEQMDVVDGTFVFREDGYLYTPE